MQMAHINDQKERYGGSSTAQTIHSQARNESKSTPRPSPYLQSAAWASQQNSEIDVTSSSPVSPLRPAHFPVRSGAQSRQSNGSHSVTSVLSSQLVSSRQSRAFGEDFRYKTILLYFFETVKSHGWVSPNGTGTTCEGVIYKQSKGKYAAHPEDVLSLQWCGQRLNLVVAFTMKLPMLAGILETLREGQKELKFKDGSQLQIADSLDSMVPSNVKKFQYACLVKHEQLILIWHDELQHVVASAEKLERKLLSMVWGAALPVELTRRQNTKEFEIFASQSKSGYNSPMPRSVYKGVTGDNITRVESFIDLAMEDGDEASFAPESLARPVIRTSAVYMGLSIGIAIFFILKASTLEIIKECLLDGTYLRLAILVTVPILLCISLFFFLIVVSNIFQMFGPIGGQIKNSRYYSCIKPNLRQAYALGFQPPHITIQMPVYKEGLNSVILPTIRSLQAAISYYESYGGSASIFINDDGMQLMTAEEASERQAFYEDNLVGWVSRPKHGQDGFQRKGKFKKASNMNFALNLSQKVEARMHATVSALGTDMLEKHDEDEIYYKELDRVLEEAPMAQAAGNIRIGEYILIVDSDTRVPENCLLYGAAEFYLSPEVAIIQHSTSVMQVSWDFFENGITFFTNIVYCAIRFAVGSGEVAAFVGHNAFLRWQAVQDVGVPETDGYIAYWSESHVSEDFDIALRLQTKGNLVRMASYHGDGFKEGVSLTVYDEVARWQKYAYGVAEMLFHPFYLWAFKGPFTPLFYSYLWSNMPKSSKLSIFAYMCSYFAIGTALPLSLLNYILVGWFADSLDHAYVTSWSIFLSLLIVFNGLSHVSLAIYRYRIGERGLISAFFENLKWAPMMTIFFGGISFHVSLALLAYLLHIDMQWGATSKEKENSTFFEEVPRILKTFKWLYLFLLVLTGGMIYLGNFASSGWAIKDYTAIVPLACNMISHGLLPIVLNPSLMVFSY